MLQFSAENVNDADVCVIDVKSYSRTTYVNDVSDEKTRRGPDAIRNMAYVGLAETYSSYSRTKFPLTQTTLATVTRRELVRESA